ncbi:hypothetical protein AWENTII_004415 [Aspergillus wentii]
MAFDIAKAFPLDGDPHQQNPKKCRISSTEYSSGYVQIRLIIVTDRWDRRNDPEPPVYLGASPATDSSRQWRTEIWKNWKKIKWTREGGDLAKLQQNLGVHINSLNLAVAVMNR